MDDSRFVYIVKKDGLNHFIKKQKKEEDEEDFLEFDSAFLAVKFTYELDGNIKRDWDHIFLNLLRGIPVFFNKHWIERKTL